MLWAILLGDSAATFSGPLQGASTGLEEGFEMDEVRRCPGIYTASCLVKPLFGARYGSASAVPGTEKSRKRAEALTLADSTIRNHFLTALEPGQLGILSAYTVYAASVCRLLVSQVSATTGGDAGQVAKLLQELEEMTVFDVGREALVHVLAGSKAALEAIVQLAADATESPWTSRIAMELLAHFVQHPLSLPRLKDPALLDTIASAIKSDSATTALLEPYISVMDVLKMKGFTAVLDLVVKPAHPTATDLANPQVVVKMTAALSVLLQGLIEFPPQVLACRISSEEVANMETRRGLMERLLSMLSRASEILVKVAEPVTSVRGGTGAKGEKGAGAAPEKKEIKLEDLRAEQQRSRAASPTPSIEGKPEAGRANSGVVPADVGAEASSSAGGGAKVTVLITTEMIQLRRQILDLLFILLKLLRAVMLTAYDAASTTSMASSSRPSVRKHYLAAVAAEETASGNPGEGDAAARATQVVLPNVVDESKMAKTPLHGVVPTLLDVLAALDFVDVRGTDYGGGAFLTPSGDSYQSTGTVTDEFSTTKLGDFYVVAKSKQTIAALIAAMSGAVTFEVDQDGLAHPLDINNQSSLLITRKASLLGGYEDGYGRQLLVLPRFMEPASSVFGDILNKFAWKEPGNAWVAVQLFNEMLPAPLPVYADLDSQSLRDYLARLQDEEDVEQLDLAADIESISGSVPHFRTYLAKSLYNVMPQLLELVKVGAVSSTRQFHLATRTLVLRLIDLDVDDIGLARGILEIVLENLAKVFDDNKTIKRRASEVLSVAGPLSAAPNMDGNDTVMEQAPTLTESPIAAEAPMLIDSDVDPAGSFELQKAASEASRWLSLLCAIAYLPAGRALLLCSRDRNGETREKPALRALALTMDVIRSLGSSSIATDLALETLQWIFSTRIPGAGDDLDDSLAVFWDTPDESDIAAVVSFILNTMRQTKDERMRSQLLLLFATIADSSSGTRVLLSSPEMRRSMRDMLDLVLDLLVIRATGGPSKIGAHELDVAIGLLSTFKQLAESSTSRRAASHFLAESVPIAEHEERVLRLNIMATHAQELMDSNGLRAMQLAERGAYDDEAAGLLDPGLCASLGELTRQLIGAMSVSQPLSGEDLLKSTLARRGTGQDDGTAEGDIEAEAPELDRMDSGFLQGDEEPSRKRTFADMMWSRPAAVPLGECSNISDRSSRLDQPCLSLFQPSAPNFTWQTWKMRALGFSLTRSLKKSTSKPWQKKSFPSCRSARSSATRPRSTLPTSLEASSSATPAEAKIAISSNVEAPEEEEISSSRTGSTSAMSSARAIRLARPTRLAPLPSMSTTLSGEARHRSSPAPLRLCRPKERVDLEARATTVDSREAASRETGVRVAVDPEPKETVAHSKETKVVAASRGNKGKERPCAKATKTRTDMEDRDSKANVANSKVACRTKDPAVVRAVSTKWECVEEATETTGRQFADLVAQDRDNTVGQARSRAAGLKAVLTEGLNRLVGVIVMALLLHLPRAVLLVTIPAKAHITIRAMDSLRRLGKTLRAATTAIRHRRLPINSAVTGGDLRTGSNEGEGHFGEHGSCREKSRLVSEE